MEISVFMIYKEFEELRKKLNTKISQNQELFVNALEKNNRNFGELYSKGIY